jgi:hypothetical protein
MVIDSKNMVLVNFLWVFCGWIGFLIMRYKTRRSFYEQRLPVRSTWDLFWWWYLFMLYSGLGPLILLISCITLINQNKDE